MESLGSKHEKYSTEEMSSGTNDEVKQETRHTIHAEDEEVDAPAIGISFSAMNEMHAYMQKYAYSKVLGL